MKNNNKNVDFTAENLPKNRREVFFDCIKQRYTTFLLIGILFLLFALPLFATMFYTDYATAGILGASESGKLEADAAAALIRRNVFISDLIYVAMLAVLSIGVAGGVRIVRQIIWADGVFFWRDFLRGIKQNGLYYALLFIFAGLLYAINSFIVISVSSEILQALAATVSVLLFAPLVMFQVSQIAIYDIKLFKSLKNAFLLYAKTLPKTLLALICCCIPFLLTLIANLAVKYVLYAVFTVFLAPLFLMGWMLYSCYVFDKTINLNYFPELIGKGIYKS